MEQITQKKAKTRSMWVVRDKAGYLLLFRNKPKRLEEDFCPTNKRDDEYRYIDAVFGDPDLFEDVTWENSPVELTINI